MYLKYILTIFYTRPCDQNGLSILKTSALYLFPDSAQDKIEAQTPINSIQLAFSLIDVFYLMAARLV